MSTNNNDNKKITINSSGFTMIPNTFLDEAISVLSPSAVKIYLVIARKTIGWHEKENFISYSQFKKNSGMSLRSISTAIKELKKLKIITTRTEGTGRGVKIYYSLTNIKINKKKQENEEFIMEKSKAIKNNEANFALITENNRAKFKETKENINLKKEEEATNTNINTAQNIQKGKNDTSSFSDLKVKLKNYGLTDNQIKKVTTEFDEPYLKNKIEQLEYVKKHKPEKVKGEGRYLYIWIINKWDDQDFINDLESRNNASQDSQKQIVRQKIQNEEESMKKEYERQQEIFASDITERLTNEEKENIDKYIDSMLQSPFYKNNKLIYDIAFRSKKIEYILTHYTKFVSYEDFVTQKNRCLKMSA